MSIKPGGPVQQPRPPIVVGGSGEKYTLPLVARYADVWNVPTYALGEMGTSWPSCSRCVRTSAGTRPPS